MDFFPLWLSLKVSVTATILTVATGLPPWMLSLTTRWAVRRALFLIRRELGLRPTVGGG